jgi:DNA-directed RNA polymerase specialized sigma24 family protein
VSPKPVTLDRVTRAASQQQRSAEQYRAALLAAREAGYTYTEIAEAAGVSKQAVRQLLLKEEK